MRKLLINGGPCKIRTYDQEIKSRFAVPRETITYEFSPKTVPAISALFAAVFWVTEDTGKDCEGCDDIREVIAKAVL